MKPLKLTYSISKEDFIDAHEEHWKSKGQGSRGNVVRGVLGIPAGLIVGYYAHWIGYVLSSVGVILALMPTWRRRQHIQAYKEFKKYGDEIHVTFEEDRVLVKTNNGESDLRWSTYLKTLDTKDYVLLYITEEAFSIIPKRAFPDRSEEFAKFAKEKIANQSAHTTPASASR